MCFSLPQAHFAPAQEFSGFQAVAEGGRPHHAGLQLPGQAMGDPQVHLEVMTVIGELEWRLRELERESLLRGSLGDPSDDAVMVELVNRLRPPAEAPTVRPS